MPTTEVLKQQLHQKMQAKYDEFIEQLKQSPVDTILDCACEKVCKEEILMCVDTLSLSKSDLKGLLALPDPLHDLFQEWLAVDDSHMGELNDCIEERGRSAGAELKSARKSAER